jgi:MATE family multidrug resistance protein
MFSLHNLVFAMAVGLRLRRRECGSATPSGAGEPEQAWRRTMIAAGLAVLIMGGVALVLAIAARPLSAVFSEDRDVVVLGASMLLLMTPFMLFDGLQYVFSYALRSLGEQVWAGVNGIIAFFFVTGGLGWWLVRSGWGAQGLVYAAGAGMVVCAVLQFARLLVVVRKSAGS